jgi:hypothetical protein
MRGPSTPPSWTVQTANRSGLGPDCPLVQIGAQYYDKLQIFASHMNNNVALFCPKSIEDN